MCGYRNALKTSTSNIVDWLHSIGFSKKRNSPFEDIYRNNKEKNPDGNKLPYLKFNWKEFSKERSKSILYQIAFWNSKKSDGIFQKKKALPPVGYQWKLPGEINAMEISRGYVKNWEKIGDYQEGVSGRGVIIKSTWNPGVNLKKILFISST